MADQLVLITGVTGHVGFACLKFALQQGFSVRAAVRSEAKAEIVRSNSALKDLQQDGRLAFVVVPDMLALDALDEAVKGVTHVIHCASRVPFSEQTTDKAYEDYIKPAVDGTLGMLKAAAKEKSVKRVVVTSSIIAIVPVISASQDTGESFTVDTRQPEPEGNWEPGTPSFVAYAAGKVNALNQAEAWMKKEQPHFDVVHIMPSFVLGRNDLWQTPVEMHVSSNAFVLSIIAGEGGLPPTGVAVNHIDDCARIHIEALDPKIEGNQGFVVNTAGSWDDAKAIVEKHFPEAVKAGMLRCKGSLGTVRTRIDVAKTEQVFGIKYTYEDCVVSVAEQYLELSKKGAQENGGLKH